MNRLLLFFLLCVLAAIGVFAQNPGPDKQAPESNPGAPAEDTVSAALDKVEAVVQRAANEVTKDTVFSETLGKQVRRLLEFDIGGMSLGHLLAGFLVLLSLLILRRIFARTILGHLKRLAERTRTDLDTRFLEVLEKPLSAFLLILGIYLSILVLPLDAGISAFAGQLFRGLTMLTVVWAGMRFTDLIVDIMGRKLMRSPGTALIGFLPLIKKALKIFVLIVGVLLVIDNLGYNITGIIATLGLGTAAVALASQDTLKNGFGALMIMLDRPFKVGDWIQIGDKVDGDVESIGLRSTKVRTWPKTILSIPNGVLANEYINNWSRMPKRRVKQVVGITYEASAEDMENLVNDIKALLAADDGVHQEFILVSFTDFGESSLDILVYYFTKSVKWLEHMEVRQRINCAIMRAIQARGLTIAVPSRRLQFEGPVASKMADLPYVSRWNDSPPGDSPHADIP
jgi:MscS family membrane protein